LAVGTCAIGERDVGDGILTFAANTTDTEAVGPGARKARDEDLSAGGYSDAVVLIDHR